MMKNLTEKQKVNLVEKYKGMSISTNYGPSVVVELHDDRKHVLLLEFGEEPYHLTLDDFISQLFSFNYEF